jgi:hypothetical protein
MVRCPDRCLFGKASPPSSGALFEIRFQRALAWRVRCDPPSHTVTFERPKTERHHRQIRGDIMLRDRNRPLVEAIDNAIEEAEDRGLTFIASILMMARLEADQSILMTRRVNDEHA